MWQKAEFISDFWLPLKGKEQRSVEKNRRFVSIRGD
jgi:hypothetical protein